MKFFLLSTLLSLCISAHCADIDIVREQRLSNVVGGTTGATSIAAWLSTLAPNGQWPASEIDYTTGCPAQTGSWPAQSHWSRINTFAAAYYGGLKNAAQFAGNVTLRASISLAMGFWFANDFTDPSCIDSGGTASCPCGTPGLWNTNWNSNIILIPRWVGQVCLLLGNTLSASELQSCQKMTGRSYNTFQTGINGVGSITGSNTLDIASIGIDLGLLTTNTSLVADAYSRVHAELTIKNGIKADGIRADGSFGQHTGVLYNGNYGKDYVNDILNLETSAGGTQFQANGDSRIAFTTLLQADQWMIFRNTVTNVSHWDFSVLGRFIALPVADNQATENLKINLTQIQVLGQLWNSPDITSVFNDMSLVTNNANAGNLIGNRMFFANDYMVYRASGFVTTLKMFSNRTLNTECVTAQNPFGFHLSDGAVYTYLNGDEYEDISAAWDWNLIPGITVDYNANILSCSTAQKTGTQSLVGGVTDGTVGVAAMRYETPITKTLNWRKVWFFLDDDIQFVMLARITSTTTAPVFSVLDQRRLNGDVLVDGLQQGSGNYSGIASLWHGGVGYTFNVSNPSTSLSLQVGTRTGSWQSIGTSKQPPAEPDLFVAWLNHANISNAISYAVYPGTTSTTFQQKVQATQLQAIRNDGSISALLDEVHNTAMLVFWEAAGGSVAVPSVTGNAPLTVKSSGNANIIIRLDTWVVTVADPTQSLATLTVTFTLGSGTLPSSWKSSSKVQTLLVTLPSGGLVGDSVTVSLF